MTRLDWDKAKRNEKRKLSGKSLDKVLNKKYARLSKPKKKIKYEILWSRCKKCGLKIHSKYKLCFNCWNESRRLVNIQNKSL